MLLSNRGVTTPANQGSPANEGPANTVVAAARVEMVIAEYFDHEGRRQRNTMLKLGDQFYTADNSVAWTQSLASVQAWLTRGIQGKLPISQSVDVQDNVDVVG
jgi:hypothetical protein